MIGPYLSLNLNSIFLFSGGLALSDYLRFYFNWFSLEFMGL